MENAKYEPTVTEMVKRLQSNLGMRYLLVGEEVAAREGRAMIYDTITKSWVRITSRDGGDQLHRDTVIDMLNNGTPLQGSLASG